MDFGKAVAALVMKNKNHDPAQDLKPVDEADRVSGRRSFRNIYKFHAFVMGYLLMLLNKCKSKRGKGLKYFMTIRVMFSLMIYGRTLVA